MSEIIKNVEDTIKKYNMLEQGDRVIVGVSGGPDSMCLLHILKSLENKYGISLYAVHLNHCFRGEAADEDMRYVEKICREWEIPAFIEKTDVLAYMKEKGLSAEEAGRVLRYALFEKISKQVGGNKIAIAQNKNDNAETVVMRLIRGTGLSGAKGIEYINESKIRPLLNVDRAHIEKYCFEQGITPCIDKTNFQPIYTRNKVRLELIPYIENNLNPNFMESISRFSQIAAEDNEFIEKEAKKIFNAIAKIGKDKVECYISDIYNLPLSIRKRIILFGIKEMLGNTVGIEQKHIELGLSLLDKCTGAAVELPFQLILFKSYDKIIFQRKNKKVNSSICRILQVPGMNVFSDLDIKIDIRILRSSEDLILKGQIHRILIDGKNVKNGLVLRNRQVGDVFSPIGMTGSKKLSNYMVDEKIPKSQRSEVLLLADGREIVWYIGKRISEKYKITRGTTDIIEVTLMRGKTNE